MVGLPSPAYKMVFGGSMGGVQDWSCSMWAQVTGGDPPTQLEVTTNSGALGTKWSTMWNSFKTRNWPTVTADHLTAYYYPAGSTVSTLIGIDEFTAIPGTGSTLELPSQLSLVASLRSSTPGRSGRGRFYLPLTDGGSLSNGQVAGGDCTTIVGLIKALVDGINALTPAEGGAFRCGVASFTKSAFYPVVTAIIDSKIDTQRRREDKVGVLFVAPAVIAP